MSEMKSLTLNDKKYDGFVDPVARALASASAVINSASGESITLSDSSENKLFGLNIYGKTTQNGTPTPDAPVAMVSVGNSGSITVSIAGENDTQTMPIATPNGLLGIPVSSGGNYTDANGQQWVCDEIDLQNKTRIQRVLKVKNFALDKTLDACDVYVAYMTVNALGGGLYPYALCTHTNEYKYNTTDSVHHYVDGNAAWVYVPKGTDCAGLEMHVMLKNPIETVLSEEEIAAYNALRTYRDNTTITNDGVAYMELEYAMDAKKYIDSMIAAPVARLSEVTLLASAWVGANSPYSQVITLDGITEYSKVDLLPSVEQLAIFHHKDLAFVTENEDGVVTVYAIGDKPTNDYTIQVQITEVKV